VRVYSLTLGLTTRFWTAIKVKSNVEKGALHIVEDARIIPYIYIIVLLLWKTRAISILPSSGSGRGSAEHRTTVRIDDGNYTVDILLYIIFWMHNVSNNTSVRAAAGMGYIICADNRADGGYKDPGFPGFIGTDESNSKRYSFVPLLLLLFFVFLSCVMCFVYCPCAPQSFAAAGVQWLQCGWGRIVGRCDDSFPRVLQK